MVGTASRLKSPKTNALMYPTPQAMTELTSKSINTAARAINSGSWSGFSKLRRPGGSFSENPKRKLLVRLFENRADKSNLRINSLVL
jgi:hypothetical protein